MRSRIAVSLAFASACSAGQMGPVFLSQVCIVVDPATYQALVQSAEIRALASARERTADSDHGGWTAFYICGRQTTIEVRAAGSKGEADALWPGRSEIVLDYGDPGRALGLRQGLESAFGPRFSPAVGEGIPSAGIGAAPEMGVVEAAPAALSTSFVEQTPGFIQARPIGGRAGRHSTFFFRSEFLPSLLLDDVVGLTAGVAGTEARTQAAEFTVAGWRVREAGPQTVASGPDATVTLLSGDTFAGIAKIDLRLRRPVDRRETILGRAVLELEGEKGSLRLAVEDRAHAGS